MGTGAGEHAQHAHVVHISLIITSASSDGVQETSSSKSCSSRPTRNRFFMYRARESVCLCVWFAREKVCTYWFTLCFGIKRINFFYITFSSSFCLGQSISTCKLSVNNHWQAYC